jgi:hypothetical protein
MNPFIIKGYNGSNYFCDREIETEKLLNAIRNQRDVTLISLRKMGKTGLIFHAFEQLKQEKSHETLYLDIFHTENLNGFINQLATAVFRMKKPIGKRMKDFFSGLRYVRPVISVDTLSGEPSVSLQIADEKHAKTTLEELFSILNERSSLIPVVVAIDEFQQINQYPEKNVEALLRGIIQQMNQVAFIFSGSNKTMLARMFGDTSRPFYQSTEMLFLEEIDPESYSSFITSHFVNNRRKVDPDTVNEILLWTRTHTWYLQYFCNRIFETGLNCNNDSLKDVIPDILLGFEPFYLEYRSLVTRHQWQLLKAIAHSGSPSAITSGNFIKQYSLTNASTVKRGIETLLARELIYNKEGQYFIYDVFFSRWLELLDI